MAQQASVNLNAASVNSDWRDRFARQIAPATRDDHWRVVNGQLHIFVKDPEDVVMALALLDPASTLSRAARAQPNSQLDTVPTGNYGIRGINREAIIDVAPGSPAEALLMGVAVGTFGQAARMIRSQFGSSDPLNIYGLATDDARLPVPLDDVQLTWAGRTGRQWWGPPPAIAGLRPGDTPTSAQLADQRIRHRGQETEDKLNDVALHLIASAATPAGVPSSILRVELPPPVAGSAVADRERAFRSLAPTAEVLAEKLIDGIASAVRDGVESNTSSLRAFKLPLDVLSVYYFENVASGARSRSATPTENLSQEFSREFAVATANQLQDILLAPSDYQPFGELDPAQNARVLGHLQRFAIDGMAAFHQMKVAAGKEFPRLLPPEVLERVLDIARSDTSPDQALATAAINLVGLSSPKPASPETIAKLWEVALSTPSETVAMLATRVLEDVVVNAPFTTERPLNQVDVKDFGTPSALDVIERRLRAQGIDLALIKVNFAGRKSKGPHVPESIVAFSGKFANGREANVAIDDLRTPVVTQGTSGLRIAAGDEATYGVRTPWSDKERFPVIAVPQALAHDRFGEVYVTQGAGDVFLLTDLVKALRNQNEPGRIQARMTSAPDPAAKLESARQLAKLATTNEQAARTLLSGFGDAIDLPGPELKAAIEASPLPKEEMVDLLLQRLAASSVATENKRTLAMLLNRCFRSSPEETCKVIGRKFNLEPLVVVGERNGDTIEFEAPNRAIEFRWQSSKITAIQIGGGSIAEGAYAPDALSGRGKIEGKRYFGKFANSTDGRPAAVYDAQALMDELISI